MQTFIFYWKTLDYNVIDFLEYDYLYISKFMFKVEQYEAKSFDLTQCSGVLNSKCCMTYRKQKNVNALTSIQDAIR